MLLEKNKLDVKKFLLSFDKRFGNFCEKAPLFLSYDLNDEGVTIYKYLEDDNGEDSKKEKLFTYSFNFNQSDKQNIYEIKQLLFKFYPIMIEEKIIEVDATPAELNILIQNKEITTEDITEKGYYKKINYTWVIDKVIYQYDNIFIRGIENKTRYNYKMKVPVIPFLKKFLEGEDPKEIFNYFHEKSYMIPWVDYNE
jgi:hypothetical protein